MESIKWLASLRPVSYILAKILRPVDLLVLKFSRGRRTLTHMLTGLDTICVNTIGARTGKIRPVVLATVKVGERWVLAATNFGSQKHPDWYYNLIHSPEVKVIIRGKARRFRARLTEGDEWDHCWSKLVSAYRGFSDYRQRAGNRAIPIFILEPTISIDKP